VGEVTFGKAETPAARSKRVFAQIQSDKRENGYFASPMVWEEIVTKNGTTQAVVHIADPYGKTGLVKTIPTQITKEQADKIARGGIWHREACDMLVQLATAYESRIPAIVQGESAIGKSFVINVFSKLIEGTKPITFDCNGQTDTGDLMAKPVPNTGGDARKDAAIQEFLASEYAQSFMATTIKNSTGVPDAVRASFVKGKLSVLLAEAGLSGGNTMFRNELGAIPKAMCYKRDPVTGEESFPEKGGDGCILHIQEVTMAKPAIINILLALRGEGRTVAKEMTLFQDRGQTLHAGPRWWVVMSANPADQEGFTAREALDKALLRGVALIRKGDLCEESWNQIAEEVCGFSIGNLPDPIPEGCQLEFHKNKELVKLIASTLAAFHLEYKDALKNDPREKEKEEKVMASQDDIAEVARLLLANQLFDASGMVDMSATFLEVVKKVYLERHEDPTAEDDDPNEFFKVKMAEALETLVSDAATGSVKIGGKTMTRSKAMNLLATKMQKPADERVREASKELAEAQAGLPDDLKNLLGL
jgi:MoxR-like ATPase